jgi:hypothetical protein
VFINTIRNKCKGITAILMYLNKAWIDEKNDLLLSELCDRLLKILLLIILVQVQRLSLGWIAIAWQLPQCICEALALARSLFLPSPKKSLGRRVFFLWVCLIEIPPNPLKKGVGGDQMLLNNSHFHLPTLRYP